MIVQADVVIFERFIHIAECVEKSSGTDWGVSKTIIKRTENSHERLLVVGTKFRFPIAKSLQKDVECFGVSSGEPVDYS